MAAYHNAETLKEGAVLLTSVMHHNGIVKAEGNELTVKQWVFDLLAKEVETKDGKWVIGTALKPITVKGDGQ